MKFLSLKGSYSEKNSIDVTVRIELVLKSKIWQCWKLCAFLYQDIGPHLRPSLPYVSSQWPLPP